MKLSALTALTGATFLVISMASQAQSKPAEKPVFPSGVPVIQVPFADDNLSFQHLNSIHLNLSFNGGPASRFQVDTGSVGIMVGADEIPGFDGKGEPGEITYSSSGVHLTGVWTTVDVGFPDAHMPDGSPVVAHMKVLAVTHKECLGIGVNEAKCSPGPAHPHMLGIGFGRGKDDEYTTALRNAFLMLNAMQKGSMRRGYTITPHGVQLGLNAESITGDWKWRSLRPVKSKYRTPITVPTTGLPQPEQSTSRTNSSRWAPCSSIQA